MKGDITTVPEQEWVPVPVDFAVSPAVVEEAAGAPMFLRIEQRGATTYAYLSCGEQARDGTVCNQSILVMADPSGSYRVRTKDISSCLLAHLMQRHGWTREAAGYEHRP